MDTDYRGGISKQTDSFYSSIEIEYENKIWVLK